MQEGSTHIQCPTSPYVLLITYSGLPEMNSAEYSSLHPVQCILNVGVVFSAVSSPYHLSQGIKRYEFHLKKTPVYPSRAFILNVLKQNCFY